MLVTKNQIVNGLSRYAKAEILPKVSDKPTKIAISVIVSALESNHAMLDGVLEHPIVSALMQCEDGMYDLDSLEPILVQSLDEYGDLPIKIPPIKFISPDVKEMTFTSSDVRRLKEYIYD